MARPNGWGPLFRSGKRKIPVGPCLAPARPLAEGCEILSVPEDFVVTRREGKVLGPAPPAFMEGQEFGLHEHTVEQEYRTLCNRHLFATPEPKLRSKAWQGFHKAMRRLARKVGFQRRATVAEVVGQRSSMKRRRFGQGMERYCRVGVWEPDSWLTEMQKLEFYQKDKILEKEDRGIQFRSPTYNAALARHLMHVEHALYRELRNQDGTPVIAKGRSPLERGILLAAMSESFSDPVYMLMDHSRFDAHVNKHLLQEEHAFYLRCRGWSAELVKLLRWQRRSRGFTQGGIRYRITAKRASGDLNTACGNSALNWGLIYSMLKQLGIVKHSILLDGDDSVVIIERPKAGTGERLLEKVRQHMLDCGMVTEVQLVEHLSEAEFCQSRVCWGEEGPVMVRNPWKVLDTLTKCPRKVDDVQGRRVLAASALGELMQNPGVPVISVAAASLLRLSGGVCGFTTPDQFERFQIYCTTMVRDSVDDTMRCSFEEAWGITVAEQLAIEQYYADLATPLYEPRKVVIPKSRDVVGFEVWDDISGWNEYMPLEDSWWRAKWAVGKYLRVVGT